MRKLLFAMVAVISAAVAGAAQGRVEVDESAIRPELKSGETSVSIPVRNTTGRALPARLHLEWVDRKDVAASSLDRVVSIAEGAGTVGSRFPLPASTTSDQVYLRLRYELGPAEAGQRVFSTMAGTVALTQIVAHAFILRVSRVPKAQPGARRHVDGPGDRKAGYDGLYRYPAARIYRLREHLQAGARKCVNASIAQFQ